MKKLWMTSLAPSEEAVKKVMKQLKTYGLEVNGHFWEDDLQKMAWIKARDALIDTNVALWLILAANEDLLSASIRGGLSLLAITVQAQRGLGFPIALLLTGGELPQVETLPTPLKAAIVLSASDATYGARVVAGVHAPMKHPLPEYRLDVYGNSQIGQWFEVGPREGPWRGAMLGVSGADISFHGVGPKGSLPSRSVLNYPMKGLKVTLGDNEYVAWAVQNDLDARNSYFVKVEGCPGSILFGPYSSDQEAEVHIVTLK
ncbi:MAG TPA: hypothetical protein VMU60_01845 [Syntrophobacteria bacterium]|nr:hypothetical protein [Syntrophobacteria bacterium]